MVVGDHLSMAKPCFVLHSPLIAMGIRLRRIHINETGVVWMNLKVVRKYFYWVNYQAPKYFLLNWLAQPCRQRALRNREYCGSSINAHRTRIKSIANWNIGQKTHGRVCNPVPLVWSTAPSGDSWTEQPARACCSSWNFTDYVELGESR